ncbi:Bax inhibitor-1 family protein [Pseudocolwellia sp. AS88]|uniref:Bax inhibitor-1 family protein n=1 Tax=Pseudocolwellia TaxID=2848177 RepID=UPI0026F356A4|nr:Bax inhibitor-1 family protein [Pseudocolwellia sp. AS88]MDO7085996.1 Bax inhibitor-1 family protein [Pseudocolwellia sp. AS88]
MEVNVFDRTHTNDKIISATAYNIVIGLALIWGFAVNWFMVLNISPESISSVNPIIFFVGYFACCFFGIYLFNKSDNPAVSFIGYNFVVVPFGLIINLVVSQYNPDIVLEAIRVTGLVTFVMMLLGSMYPAFFNKIIGGLTVALISVIIVELIMVFVFDTHHGILDWIVAIIFCGYIGYDWARANAIPKTYDNAIDSAAALYMDIINLFLRILRILGRK